MEKSLDGKLFFFDEFLETNHQYQDLKHRDKLYFEISEFEQRKFASPQGVQCFFKEFVPGTKREHFLGGKQSVPFFVLFFVPGTKREHSNRR